MRLISAARFSLRRAWRVCPGYLGLFLVTSLAGALLPALQVYAIADLVRTLTEDAPFRDVMLSCVVVALVAATSLPIGEISHALGYRITGIVRADYDAELAGFVARMPVARLQDAASGDELHRAQLSIPMSVGFMHTYLIGAGVGMVAAAGVGVAVFTINPLAGVLAVAALCPVLLATRYVSGFQDDLDTPIAQTERRKDYLLDLLVTQRSGSDLLGLGSAQKVAVGVRTASQRRALIEGPILRAVTVSQLISGGITIVLILGALLLISADTLNAAGAAAGVIGALSSINAIRSAGASLGGALESTPKVLRYRDLMARHDWHRTGGTAQPVPISRIDIDNVTYTYPRAGRPALASVSLQLHRGETVALVGRNGAGKTTLVNMIMGLRDRDEGRILFDDQPADEVPHDDRIATFSLLTQEFGRYEFTVRECIGLGVPESDISDARLWEALKLAHADDIVSALDGGLDAQLGEQWGGAGLSAGQWQRIALARVYLRRAPVLILDEPTSAVDSETEEQIFSELREDGHDRLTIVVSHRAWTLRNMDRIYVLEEGRIVETGTYRELISARGTFHAMFALQRDESEVQP